MTLPLLSANEIADFLEREFPQVADDFAVENVGALWARVRLLYHDKRLRPGGTISGPSMVALAVTTQLNINFLRRPAPRDLIGEARLLKLGKRLAVGEVAISSVADGELVAHAVGTYSIPPSTAAVS